MFNACNTDITLGIQIIVFPEGSELMFSSHVPDGEFQVLVFNSLNVKTLKTNVGNKLI